MTGVQTCALPICFPVTIQWAQENMFEGKRISLEQTRTIADIILRSLESVQKIGQIVGTAMIK